MTCGNTQDALNLMHAGLPLFLYCIPHPLNVVVSLFLREFQPYSTSRPDIENTWFTQVYPKGMICVTIKMATSKNTHRLFCLATILEALRLNVPDPAYLRSSKGHIKWENIALLSDIYLLTPSVKSCSTKLAVI